MHMYDKRCSIETTGIKPKVNYTISVTGTEYQWNKKNRNISMQIVNSNCNGISRKLFQITNCIIKI